MQVISPMRTWPAEMEGGRVVECDNRVVVGMTITDLQAYCQRRGWLLRR